MTNYLNKQSREVAVCLAGCIGFADVLSQATDYRNAENVQPFMRSGMECFQNALNALEDGLSEDEKARTMKLAKDCMINVLPRTNPSASIEWYPVEKRDLYTLLNFGVEAECEFCEKHGNEVNHCRIRKALTRIGVNGNGDDECQFRGFNGVEI